MQDRYGHRISYLRVSITDRCNERCTYCMPQELQEWLPREEILSFDQIKLNTVLMRGRNEDQLIPLIEFAAARKLILRFIEMMPVSTTDVLSEHNFVSTFEAKRLIESFYGSLIPEAEFQTNDPATY